MSRPEATAVLVGGTNGVGYALGRELARRGWRTLLAGSSQESADAARDRWEAEGAPGPDAAPPVVLAADVADPALAISLIEDALEGLPEAELFIYLAGTQPAEATWADLRVAAAGLRVNLESAAVLLGWAADRFQARGRGRIAAVGSIAGDRGRKQSPVYNAGKAGLHALCDGLRHRLHGTGVGVTTLRPGWVATRMLGAEKHASPLTVSPERAARTFADALERGRDVVYAGWWWRWVGLVLKAMPAGVHKRFAPP